MTASGTHAMRLASKGYDVVEHSKIGRPRDGRLDAAITEAAVDLLADGADLVGQDLGGGGGDSEAAGGAHRVTASVMHDR